MARRSALGLFGIFGRSEDLRRLDDALRSVGLHPRLVPEAVKLTTVKLLAEAAGDTDPAPQSYRTAAELLAYCMLGAEAFAGENDAHLTSRVERRIETAIAAGDNLDAQIVLLAVHAAVIQPSVVRRFGLESTTD